MFRKILLGLLLVGFVCLPAHGGRTVKRGPSSVDLGMVIPFCGQGGNAANRYIGPATGIGVDVTPANATCDGYDAAAVGDADEIPLGISIAYTVQGMACQLDSGTNDTVEMTLYDDTVEVPAITCIITAAGGIETCSVAATASIAAGSLLAIEADPDDDNLSAQDFYCLLFVSF
jgi:hypothetical protein